ncbi:MAG: bifunctional 5,10-methylene-tetrahydrofolate dehydrogenase/5,10-methylene-tetrahydrofolate cyclohydrolase [Bacteroidetes bacterium]|nr:bifunctional 5,10-methylene-tetrahydrofolate dehydrogenase/5,10-methylene-tetrahydrofolate cyclohydrolase [Bacteroidota bacterium]
MQLLDGLSVSKTIKLELKEQVEKRKSENKKIPHLAAVLVGNNGASQTYVNAKVKACNEVGFDSTLIHLTEDISEHDLLFEIEKLNLNPDIDGYIVQLPLPQHINEKKILLAIDPMKDVDGFHPENVGRMMLNMKTFLPATPMGIITLLERNNIETSGKHAVVLGRSHIVGLPMSILLQRNHPFGNCTVTLCHSKTKNIEEICKSADIIIAAVGIPEFLRGDMVKAGAVVVDVGITRVNDASKKSGFRLLGDVNFEEVSSKCSFITPVPGGVGPMTIVSLMQNTLASVEHKE